MLIVHKFISAMVQKFQKYVSALEKELSLPLNIF